MASDGVTIKEGGKNKFGKPKKNKNSTSMTRAEYLLETSRSYVGNKTLDFNLPNMKETNMDETIDMNSTIRSNRGTQEDNVPKKLTESYQILPPIDSSRMNFSLAKDTSMAKTARIDKININEESLSFIKQNMISKSKNPEKRLRMSKSEMSFISSLPLVAPPLSQVNPIPPKVDTGRKHKHKSSFSKVAGSVLSDKNESANQLDEFNRQLLSGSLQPSGSGSTLLKLGKKPRINRTKNFSEIKNPNLFSYEDKISKKAYIERIRDIRVTQKPPRYYEL